MDNNDEQERSYKNKQKDDKNEKLWKDLQIDFRLEAFKFPDNKIYGIIDVIPESSRKLIKHFVLVVNKSTRIEFDSNYKHLSASGFKTDRKNPSAYIEAHPTNPQWSKEIKTSKLCYFVFTGETFALNPTISFDWLNNEAILVVKWYHIGDKYAHKYVLHLDDTEIQYIRQKLINDVFIVRIKGFEPGKTHTFQLTAKLNNGKETYQSDLKEFTVPDKKAIDNDNLEFITVLDEPAPSNLPAYVATKNDIVQDEVNLNENKQLQKPNNNNDNNKKKKKKNCTCCNGGPHETFPGIEHYFHIISNKLPSSDDDDDDDVIITNN